MLVSGCSVLKKDINLRSDVFQEKPIWESTELQHLRIAQNMFVASEMPGLALLIRQVLGEDIGIGDNNFLQGNFVVQATEEPLPPEIANNPVTKALVRLIASSVSATSSLSEDEQKHWALPDLELSTKDFESFVMQLSKSVVVPFHQKATEDKNNHHFKIQAFANGGEVNWGGLFNAYLMNYYNGKFIDRVGGAYSKPKLGLTITNETITAFISVFIEAIFDYVILTGNNIKVPIVYEADATTGEPIKFLTNGHAEPTLAKVVKKINGSYHLKYVVEPVQGEKTKVGITEQKLCVIRATSGILGDVAQGASGTIVRLFGGGTGGIAFLNGKISIGDNETLAKVIDTLLENWAKRTTELYLSTIMYDLTYGETSDQDKLYFGNDQQTLTKGSAEQQEAWGILKSRLDLSKLIGCFFDE